MGIGKGLPNLLCKPSTTFCPNIFTNSVLLPRLRESYVTTKRKFLDFPKDFTPVEIVVAIRRAVSMPCSIALRTEAFRERNTISGSCDTRPRCETSTPLASTKMLQSSSTIRKSTHLPEPHNDLANEDSSMNGTFASEKQPPTYCSKIGPNFAGNSAGLSVFKVR